jgi:hypothetical protein
MIDFRRGVGNVAVLRWGASGIARNTQIYIYICDPATSRKSYLRERERFSQVFHLPPGGAKVYA